MEVQEKYGEDAYIDNLYQEEDIEDLRDKIEALDEKAADEDSFWGVSIEQSLEELDEED